MTLGGLTTSVCYQPQRNLWSVPVTVFYTARLKHLKQRHNGLGRFAVITDCAHHCPISSHIVSIHLIWNDCAVIGCIHGELGRFTQFAVATTNHGALLLAVKMKRGQLRSVELRSNNVRWDDWYMNTPLWCLLSLWRHRSALTSSVRIHTASFIIRQRAFNVTTVLKIV